MRDMDWVGTLSRIVVAIPRPVGRALVAPLLVLPSFRKADRVFRITRELSELERAEDFQVAERLREDALERTEPGFSAPLWLSKGFDRLRRNIPDEALAAFEQGIAQLGEHATMYGVSQPDALYCGAALAAHELGRGGKARDYYAKCVNLSASGSRRPESDYERWRAAKLEHLRSRLGEPTRDV